jgi:hypothetical protein
MQFVVYCTTKKKNHSLLYGRELTSWAAESYKPSSCSVAHPPVERRKERQKSKSWGPRAISFLEIIRHIKMLELSWLTAHRTLQLSEQDSIPGFFFFFFLTNYYIY